VADIEVYSKEWCPYCKKAKALLASKGLEFAEIDITNDPAGTDRMIARSGRRTVPQIFIDGDAIGGYDDLAILNDTGELDRRLGVEGVQIKRVYDVVVVGAGPAGMAAAIYAARKNLSVLMVASDVGGQMGTTYEVQNYPGFQMVTGPDLAEKFRDHAAVYDIDQLVGHKVTGIGMRGRCKVLTTGSGRTIVGHTVIIASGAQKRKLRIPGEAELAGRGVVYCSTCDGPLFRGLRIAIVGGGNSALEAAIEMDGVAAEVHVIARSGFRGDRLLEDKVTSSAVRVWTGWAPTGIHGDSKVDGLEIEDRASGERRRLEVDGVFIEIGLYANSDFAMDLVETNETGEIVVDRRGRTGARGVFAAGDVTDAHDKQIIIAAGAGATAALSAFEYLAGQA